MNQITGSCNCGETRYTVAGEAKNVVNCHCGFCRKMNGAAFSTYVVVADTDFTLQSGKIGIFQVSDNASKSVCLHCGTPMFNENPKYTGLKILHLGSIDKPADFAPQLNIYCESQVDWLDGVSQLTSMDQGIS